MQRQTDDVEIVALDTADPQGRRVLNAVGARLVHGLAALDIAVDDGIVQMRKGDLGDLVRYDRFVLCDHRHAADDAVGVVRQHAQHARGVGLVGRLA